MANMIILIIFAALLGLMIFGAIGAWIAGEKGLSPSKGFTWGLIGNVFGLIFILTWKTTDKELASELYQRKLITKSELDKTIELSTKKQDKKNKKK